MDNDFKTCLNCDYSSIEYDEGEEIHICFIREGCKEQVDEETPICNKWLEPL